MLKVRKGDVVHLHPFVGAPLEQRLVGEVIPAKDHFSLGLGLAIKEGCDGFTAAVFWIRSDDPKIIQYEFRL